MSGTSRLLITTPWGGSTDRTPLVARLGERWDGQKGHNPYSGAL
jgi:hypothetical protein